MKQTKAKTYNIELEQVKQSITDKMYKDVNEYLDLFPVTIKERDPVLDATGSGREMIRNVLSEAPSLESFGGKNGLTNINRQVTNLDASLNQLKVEM